jgi:hypothetical protein
MQSGPSMWPIRQLPTGKLAALAAEYPIAIAITNLPIMLGGMARGDEQIRVVLVQGIDEVLRGIDLPRERLWFFTLFFADRFGRVKFAIPDAFVAQRQFHLGGGYDAVDHQRLVILGDSQSTLRIVARKDSPEHIGIRVLVESPRKPADFGDECAAGLGWLRNKAGITGKLAS